MRSGRIDARTFVNPSLAYSLRAGVFVSLMSREDVLLVAGQSQQVLHESRRHPASLVGGVSSYEPDLGEALLCVGKATEKLATDHQVADRAVDESQMVPDLPPLRREHSCSCSVSVATAAGRRPRGRRRCGRREMRPR